MSRLRKKVNGIIKVSSPSAQKSDYGVVTQRRELTKELLYISVTGDPSAWEPFVVRFDGQAFVDEQGNHGFVTGFTSKSFRSLPDAIAYRTEQFAHRDIIVLDGASGFANPDKKVFGLKEVD